ncbi:MAG: DegT/DnrJ/EryC1/StrS family aminotransferase [Fibrobacteria bacterium]|nr:DegT/DnrJ/EryC1/StrS family aminotransferase [Fibrobacteria bacterium]
MDKLAILGGQQIFKKSFKLYNSIGPEEQAAVAKVMKSGNLSAFLGTWSKGFLGGAYVQEHEAAWKAMFGVNHAVSMNSATSCLYSAIGAIGVGPGDEVIVSPFTMTASATAILAFNAIPVFVDIDPLSFNLSPDLIEKSITTRTKAIIVPNIFGLPADYTKIMAIARHHGLKVIEDNAQAILATYGDKYAGTIGDIGVFSLNYHKHIHTGEGGVCLTDNDELAERLQLIRNHAEAVVGDKGTKNLINMIGFNFRMGELEAAIGIAQLQKVKSVIDKKRDEAAQLSKVLKTLPHILIPDIPKSCTHSFYIYPILYKSKSVSRETILSALEKEGVPVAGGYVEPLYLQPLYQNLTGYGDKGCPFKCPHYSGTLNYTPGLCPTAEHMHARELFFIPLCMYDFTKDQISMIGKAFVKVFNQYKELEGNV